MRVVCKVLAACMGAASFVLFWQAAAESAWRLADGRAAWPTELIRGALCFVAAVVFLILAHGWDEEAR